MAPLDTTTKSIRVSSRSHRHLMAAAKYFECTVSAMIMLLLEAGLISKLDRSLITPDLEDKFFDDLDDRSAAEDYLFKD